ncbi:ribosome maturation factor RimM [Buchnera aphidicola (Rhopalosiphum padi)]|uniref:Ribosome maturation factor RimM n=1 Tax=Buchnera aphidicola subsp. Rhopalosiphum padi TaxID=98793 RepID=A0A4D6YHB8_BUCRP|nr:ribosome maturation factor RimM [Buchnera aphidicola (Rhopalosiphum padi)]
MNIILKKPLNPIVIGKIGKAYGILGWIKIFSFSENKEKIFSYFPWFIFKQQKWEMIQIDKWKKHNNNFIIHIKNIIDRSMISKFTNLEIFIEKNTLPILKKDEYYWNDIIDCKVFNTRKTYLGKVINLIRNQNSDVLIIQNHLEKNNLKKIMIPFVHKKIVQCINITHKIITVIWN